MRIGAYEIESEIGRGGMGAVHRARSPRGRIVALKLLAHASGEAAERFERERRLLASFSLEDGFVPLVDAGREAGRPFVVMPFLEGGTLEDRLRRGPLAVQEARALGERLATALGKAHARGIVHRDFKPSNVLFDGEGRAFVADLGLAKHFRRDVEGASASRALSGTGMLAGTIGYAPPEQLDDARGAGPRSDVFALGAVLHECLAGECPFGRESLSAFVTRLKRGEAPAVTARRSEVSEDLAAVVARALARDPERRFEDGAALARALAACRASAGARAGRKRAQLLAMSVFACAVVAAGLAAWAFLSGETTPAPSPPSPPPRPIEQRRTEAARAEVARGDSLVARKDTKGAIAAYDRAIALDPKLVSAWTNRAVARGDDDDLDGEIADSTRAIELDPKLALAWTNRALARGKRGDWSGAIEDSTHAIELDPKDAYPWLVRGRANMRRGDRVRARSDLERFFALGPDHPSVPEARQWLDELGTETAADLVARAGIANGAKDYDSAAALATRAIELDPSLARAWAHRSEARGQKGDWDGQLADANRAIELDPTLASAWTNRGQARGQKDDWQGQLEDTTRATELDPKLAVAWVLRGVARGKKGDKAGVIEDATRAIEADPGFAFAWVSRGQARLDTGDRAGAKGDLERFLELAPDGPFAAKAREWLAGLSPK